MKRLLAIPLFFLLFAFGTAQAQNPYTTGIGLRGSYGPGITIKHHIAADDAIEAILSSWYRGAVITVLYEKHFPAFDVTNLRWYVGIGGHAGFWNTNNNGRWNNPWFEDGEGGAVIGLDLIGGLEYTFEEVPINLSLDYKPGFHLIGYTGYWGGDIAASIRYVF